MFIRECRKKAGFTQEQLAEMVGVHVNTLAKWENGSYSPRVSELQKICTVLGCTEAELLNGTIKQEFEVKILMGVKSLSNVAGLEIKDDSFFYGVDDEKPQIHIGGKINIGTQQERDEALKKIIANFHKACWMFDHKSEAEAQIPDCGAIQPA
ncbi:MAG: helix-turn-helix transcriptional regulator [Synergistaceae bacterium]|nr:helix-turn-helix transcriptional regulator [Synergistaceae bacterium]